MFIGSVEEKSGDGLGSFVVEGWTDVAVHAQCDRDHRVAITLLHDSRVDASLEGEGGPSVDTTGDKCVDKSQ